MTPMSRRTLLLLAALALWLPFVGRPLFVDDHAHFQEAISRGRQPEIPYDETGLGWKKGEVPGEANPPLSFYIVGGATRMLGNAPWKSRLFLLPFHLLGLWGFFGLARRWTRHPLWTSLLWLTTPHYWLTVNSLLLDALLPAFLLSGLYLWVDGWEKESPARLAGAGFLLGLAPLVKYTGVIGWAAAAGWVLLAAQKRRSPRWGFLLLPLLMMAGWCLWTKQVYGEVHFIAVARASATAFDPSRLRTLLIFFVVSTPVVLVGFAAALRNWKSEPIDTWLFLWTAAGLAGLLGARGWVSARYFIVLGPAAILLSVRKMEEQGWAARRSFRLLFLGAAALWGLALAGADALQAGVDPAAARDLEKARRAATPETRGRYPSTTLSGLGFYLPEETWAPIAPGERPLPGETVALPSRQLPRPFWPDLRGYQAAAAFTYSSPLPIRLQDGPTGAGWYGSIWGKAPLSWTRDPLETYLLLISPTEDNAPRGPSKT